MENKDFIGEMKSNESHSKNFTKVKQTGNVVNSNSKNNAVPTDYINIYWDEWKS
ncbi:hypothetical protein [Alkalihalobacterium alkalinitrilicum]|uniref:hypothetical protein n=1 Tax=Alkalihalobacterium alkalinitrilicum TaxID=427920 RepID=UPI00130300C3|nr:hypothetical protein [Alkalihalobacterium alkalinitrilicum]